MKITKNMRKGLTLSALLTVAAVTLSGCSEDGKVGGQLGEKYESSNNNGGVSYAIIDNPINPEVKKTCYVRGKVEDQLRNAYDLAKYIEGRTVSDPLVRLMPMVVMDNKKVDTQMDLEDGVLEDVQNIVSKMSSCHEMFLVPDIDLAGKSLTQDFVLKIRFKESTEGWGNLNIAQANQKDDWEIAYDSNDPVYTKEIKRVMEENGDMAALP